jgi:hypothetical protein
MKPIKYTNMSQIKGITNLQQLVMFDSIIRKTCKRVINPIDYDDIVNEMYIKINLYFERNIIISGGYVFLTMKTINLNLIKANNRNDYIEITENIERVIDDYNEYYYEEIDDKLDEITEFLSEFLDKDQIYLYQYYKLNGLKTTAIFFKKSDSSIKYKIKKIFQKIKEHGGLEQFNDKKTNKG